MTGTIARAVTGKITVVYAQKVGRKTIRVTKTTRISKGRWTITLRLPAKLTHGAAARGRGTVTASYAGTKTINKGTARRAVTRAKRKSRK